MTKIISTLSLESVSNGDSQHWNTWDYYIPEVEVHPLLRYFPIKHDFYQLALCLSGTIRVRVAGEEVFYGANTFSAFPPSTVIEVIETSKDFKCELLFFKKSFLVETLNNIYFLERFKLLANGGTRYLKVTSDDSSLLSKGFQNIRSKMKESAHHFRKEVIRGLIILLLYEAENIGADEPSYKVYDTSLGREKLLSDFKDLLHKNFYQRRKVSFYANELNVNPERLSYILKEYTGLTTKEHIDQIILAQAKVLLKSLKYNVSEVAALLNYNNLEEFTRFFKHKSGETPLRYQKQKVV